MSEPTRTTDETGREILLYEDGTRKDARTGYFLTGPQWARITKENAGAMLARRHELNEQAIQNAADQKAIELIMSGRIGYITIDQIGSSPAVAAVASKLTELILLAKSGREVEGILVPWLKMMGLGTSKVEFEAKVTHSDDETYKALVQILGFLREAFEPPAVEGKVIDENPTS